MQVSLSLEWIELERRYLDDALSLLQSLTVIGMSVGLEEICFDNNVLYSLVLEDNLKGRLHAVGSCWLLVFCSLIPF